MKTRFLSLLTIPALLLGAATVVFAQGTAFTYNGRLDAYGTNANGSYDLQFYLRDAAINGNPVGTTNTLNTVALSNGLFTVTLDFGEGIFTGADRWLEIGVRTNGGGAFTTLSPRQKLTPTPYAITASNLSGTLPATQLSGTLPAAQLGGIYSGTLTLNNAANSFAGNGAGLTSVNAATLGGFGAASFWQLIGNSGTTPGANFLGTTDNQPLELTVNGQRAFRLEPTASSPNVIGGFSGNHVDPGVVGATISGGGGSGALNLISGSSLSQFGTISGGSYNSIQSGAYGTIAGGIGNRVSAGEGPTAYCSIGGGSSNMIISDGSTTIAGGSLNWARQCNGGSIGGGVGNLIDMSPYGTIGGGGTNSISISSYATIGGGRQNRLSIFAGDSTIGGGANNYIGQGLAATIGGGDGNLVYANYASIAGGLGNWANGSFGSIGGGSTNVVNGLYGTISGGENNAATNHATVGGGQANVAGGTGASVAGGMNNNALSDSSSIGGGSGNSTAFSDYSAIGGGSGNSTAFADYSAIGGGLSNHIRAIQGSFSTIAGGQNNFISSGMGSGGSVIGGGNANSIGGPGFASIAGGHHNYNYGQCDGGAIGGGEANRNGGAWSVVGGGMGNHIVGDCDFGFGSHYSTVGGGSSNNVVANFSTIAGGRNNLIAAGPSNVEEGSSIGGGSGNVVTKDYGTIPGGNQAKVSNYGQMAYASGQFGNTGDAQTSVLVCRATTTDATPTELFLDGASQRMIMPTNSTWAFDILVTGRTTNGISAAYQLLGTAKNNAGVSVFLATPQKNVLAEDLAAWDVSMFAPVTNGAIMIRVTGQAATSIRWVASVRTVEVTY